MNKVFPRVVFAIPLRAKNDPTKWSSIKSNLAATLESIQRQTDQNYTTIICGHDKPEINFPTDTQWLFADWEPPTDPAKGSWDKAQKRKAILSYCKLHEPNGFYLFCLDADDFISPEMVAYIRDDDNRVGYIVDKGYVYDMNLGNLAEMTPPLRAFHKSCGSCAAFWLTLEDLPSIDGKNSEYWNALRQHGKFPEISATFGRNLEPIPFHGALYTLNHGANLSVEQGVSDVQTTHAKSHNITDQDKRKEILEKFTGSAALG